MASAVTANTYLLQLHRARTHLHLCFRRAHELLTDREADLLRQLDKIQTSYEKETKSREEEIQDLEKSKLYLKTSIHDNDTLNKALALLNEKIEQNLRLTSATRAVRFQWNTAFDGNLQLAGEIITTYSVPPAVIPHSNLTPVIPQTPIPQPNFAPVIPDYMNKFRPVLSCCKLGIAPRHLCIPSGLAIDPQSGRIYIADYGNRVQVFTPDVEFCYTFNSNMHWPWSICINNITVYVSQYSSHCITLYKLNGEYLNVIGSEGYSNGKFKYPTGIAVSATTEHIYVCDAGNNRVQIFDNSLNFHSHFGSNTLNVPSDIKLPNDLVIILDAGNPCIHIFSITNCSLLNSIISRVTPGTQIADSYHFTMDAELNLMLTDYSNHCIKVFSKTGDFITQIGREGHSIGEFINPRGIAIDKQNRIIVVSANENYALQIF